MRRNWGAVIVGIVLVVVAAIALVTIFGSETRAIMGAATNSLAGSTNIAPNTEVLSGRKRLQSFGKNSGAGEWQQGVTIGGYPVTPPMPATSESYARQAPNPMVTAREDRFSTFAIDVDTASYTLARRKLESGQWPNADGVRVEEFLNYFKYDYPSAGREPYSVQMDAAPSPFSDGKTLLRVGLQARKVAAIDRKPTHLTFLVDVSGSMQEPDRLPLAQRSLHLLVDNLNEADSVGLVTYAGAVRLVLDQTSAVHKREIHEAIDSLSAGGGTAMSDGLALAYRVAAHALKPGELSRVIVLSDGDANLGPVSQEAMQSIIAGHVSEGVTLSVVGFGVGNYQDARMEALADKGNGNYSYVDSMQQAKRIFQDQISGTLEVVAKDVKVQVEFNPDVVIHYRLVGYENRAIADADFRNDRVDAGEMGAGHNVTALYELDTRTSAKGTLATVHVRAKTPSGTVAEERAFPFATDSVARSFAGASPDLRFATAVMGFGEILRGSNYASGWTLDQIDDIATPLATDTDRAEFLSLVRRANGLCAQQPTCRNRRGLAIAR
jgi:Ca-activated chloride channel family protein